MKTNLVKPKVSIILVNYNNSKYLNRCLHSLYQQTFKNFEIIFIDDSSTDNSLKIANQIINKYNFKKYNITVNKKKTSFGSFNQMNCILKGLKLSKGEIISFLDSDDFFHKDKIKNIIELNTLSP